MCVCVSVGGGVCVCVCEYLSNHDGLDSTPSSVVRHTITIRMRRDLNQNWSLATQLEWNNDADTLDAHLHDITLHVVVVLHRGLPHTHNNSMLYYTIKAFRFNAASEEQN